MLIKLRRSTQPDDPTETRSGSRWLAVALVTFANGGDNVSAYVPAFATRTPIELLTIVVVFLALTAARCGHCPRPRPPPRSGPTIRRIARPLTPFVLMAIGVLILIESGAYCLFFG